MAITSLIDWIKTDRRAYVAYVNMIIEDIINEEKSYPFVIRVRV